VTNLFKYYLCAFEQIATVTLGFSPMKSYAFVQLVEQYVACFGI